MITKISNGKRNGILKPNKINLKMIPKNLILKEEFDIFQEKPDKPNQEKKEEEKKEEEEKTGGGGGEEAEDENSEKVWKIREKRVLYFLVNVHLGRKEYHLALNLLEKSIEEYGKKKIFILFIYLIFI
jgi:hypothetical protein